MEEANAYIETGTLELYVLDQLTQTEREEVEVMVAKYPEITTEIRSIERAMEAYAIENAILPSEDLGQKILQKISENENTGPTTPPVVTLDTSHYQSKIRTLRFALVACIALLIVSSAALFSAHSKLNLAQDKIAGLLSDKQKFAATVSYMQQTNAELHKIADMPDDPDWKTVKLAGTKMDPAAKVTVYWHISGRHVMVDNSKMELPANDKTHQYQLWALVNGRPVDLGVFDVTPDATPILLNMKEISSAQTFAVTLEKRGGSVSPTMDQMIVAGNVSI